MAWQKSLIRPICKDGDKSKACPASYRGIYPSSALAKLFEGILISRLTKLTDHHPTHTWAIWRPCAVELSVVLLDHCGVQGCCRVVSWILFGNQVEVRQVTNHHSYLTTMQCHYARTCDRDLYAEGICKLTTGWGGFCNPFQTFSSTGGGGFPNARCVITSDVNWVRSKRRRKGSV